MSEEIELQTELEKHGHDFMMYGAALDIMDMGLKLLEQRLENEKDPDKRDALVIGVSAVILFMENRMKEHKKNASAAYELVYGEPLPESHIDAFDTLTAIINPDEYIKAEIMKSGKGV